MQQSAARPLTTHIHTHTHATLHPAGALERNLIPVKADHKLTKEQIIGDPVKVHAAGVAFPHPDKVRVMHGWCWWDS